MNKHLSLDRPITLSLEPKYYCGICKNELWTRCGPMTNWQEWLFTKDNKRHYKTKCNLINEKLGDKND